VLRDLKAPGGGFYCAEDADSEGEEGKFYQWTESEIRSILDADEAALAIETFGIEKDGNFLDEARGSGRAAMSFSWPDRPERLPVKLWRARGKNSSGPGSARPAGQG